MEYNIDEINLLSFEIDNSLLNSYNAENQLNLELLPANAYSLPEDFQHSGVRDYEELNIEVNTTVLNDQTMYGLPLRIKSVSQGAVSEIMPSVVVVFSVDDLAGWYTVDWLPKNGESQSQYSNNPMQRRRYIKRTGETTWETGYVFRCYTQNEDHRSGSVVDIQFISIDPVTRKILIRQGNYATSEDNNSFDVEKNELHLEYLYSAWAGWWNHERMHDRSLTK